MPKIEREGGDIIVSCITCSEMFKVTRCNPDSDTATFYGNGKRAPMKFYTGGDYSGGDV